MTPAKTLLPATAKPTAVPIKTIDKNAIGELNSHEQTWCAANGFAGEPQRILMVPDDAGNLAKVLWGKPAEGADPFSFGRLARALPEGLYRVEGDLPQMHLAVLGWLLEAYSFERYRKAGAAPARLICPEGVNRAQLLREAEAHVLVRDLINTPASDMGPDELEAAAHAVAEAGGAKVSVIKGKALETGYPMIHAVGKASPRAPRLIDFSWGPPKALKVTLVGKGVCFDTGGLDIKPASGMLTMKKDMGGAATVLGLAQAVMAAKLPVRLRVLIPAVENAISGNAFRPGDILVSRKGLTVEIGNTDAEGRLVLADALTRACEESPDLLIDMATLTGAARVALGPDLPPFYTDDEALAGDLARHAAAANDPLWRMPLWQPYAQMMDGKISDLNNASESGFAGSITAALFLKRFAEGATSWVHFDIFGWVPAPKPGRPRGGEAQGLRALFNLIEERAKA